MNLAVIDRPKYASDPAGYMRVYRREKRTRGLCWECTKPAHPGTSRCEAHSLVQRLDAVDVYDLLTPRIPDVGVWSFGERRIIGRWKRIDEIHGHMILRGDPKALEVLAEGETWEAALLKLSEG